MAEFRTIESLGNLEGKRVLVRVDLNVPFWQGRVTDDSRIRAIVPTIQKIVDQGARAILLSHSGRPKGKVMPEFSLSPLLGPLREALQMDVAFSPETTGKVAADTIAHSEAPVILLENVRFSPGEEANDPEFAAKLAALGDAYLNDAFPTAHRAHASTEGITRLLPSAAGLAMQQEIEALEKVLDDPARPVAAVVGGAKVSTKLQLLQNLTGRGDHLIIGGAMANTFLAAKGYDVGASLAEFDLLEDARAVMKQAEAVNCHIHLPVDVVLASEFKEGASSRIAGLGEIGASEVIVDLGPETVKALIGVLETCKSLVWNGPLGAFEMEPFDRATVDLARAAAELAKAGKIMAVAGGGDTLAALKHAGVRDDFSHVSTAGGAFLEWMEGRKLPGVEALKKVD